MKVYKIRRGVIILPQSLVTIVVEADGEDNLMVFTVDEQNMKFIDEKQIVETKAPEPLSDNIKDLLRAIWEHGLECSESDEMDECDEIAMVLGCFDELKANRDSLLGVCSLAAEALEMVYDNQGFAGWEDAKEVAMEYLKDVLKEKSDVPPKKLKKPSIWIGREGFNLKPMGSTKEEPNDEQSRG